MVIVDDDAVSGAASLTDGGSEASSVGARDGQVVGEDNSGVTVRLSKSRIPSSTCAGQTAMVIHSSCRSS